MPEKADMFLHSRLQNALQTIVATLAVASLVSCRTTPDKNVFAVIDSDADGRVTLAEAESYGFKRMFKRFDTDRDGVISSADGPSASPNLMRARDLDADGKITFGEYTQAGRKQGVVAKLFKTADTDKDGFISPSETEAYLSAGGSAMLSD